MLISISYSIVLLMADYWIFYELMHCLCLPASVCVVCFSALTPDACSQLYCVDTRYWCWIERVAF
ncbi:hypothetical protein DAI22_07g092300 [Oryza sativa Japonica Group]|nr:hypothetical protein DAI22_07g092300 [Oryza sativa Japonica Group]